MTENMQHESRKETAKAGSVRTCAGCGKRAAANELVRVILGLPPLFAVDDPPKAGVAAPCANIAVDDPPKAGVAAPCANIAVDVGGSRSVGAFGRGASVHPTDACVAKACRGGFARAFK